MHMSIEVTAEIKLVGEELKNEFKIFDLTRSHNKRQFFYKTEMSLLDNCYLNCDEMLNSLCKDKNDLNTYEDIILMFIFTYFVRKTNLTNIKNFNINEYNKIVDGFILFLINKNERYGDSALKPIRFFAKSDNKEQIKVRIDDKLNRILNQSTSEDEDVLMDLIGYFILLEVAIRLEQQKN